VAAVFHFSACIDGTVDATITATIAIVAYLS
jgi:hypothetical protein